MNGNQQQNLRDYSVQAFMNTESRGDVEFRVWEKEGEGDEWEGTVDGWVVYTI